MKNKDLLFIAILMAAGAWGWVLGDTFVRLLDIALIGVLCHYFNGMANAKSIECDVLDYFSGAFKSTLASLGGCVVAVFAIVQSGHAETMDYMVMWSAFTSGYLSDGTLNKPPPSPSINMG